MRPLLSHPCHCYRIEQCRLVRQRDRCRKMNSVPQQHLDDGGAGRQLHGISRGPLLAVIRPLGPQLFDIRSAPPSSLCYPGLAWG